MPVFDELQRASFDGLEFPVRAVHIRCSYRTHVHEYLRVDGGVIEKMKRGLYTIDMEAEFHATIKNYGQLWPNTLAALRNKFEQGITSTLVIPTIGAIPAMMTEWDQTAEMGRVRSGERARLPFIEEQTETFLSTALVQVDTSSVRQAATNLDEMRKQLRTEVASASIFEAVNEAANLVTSIKDQRDIYGGMLAARAAHLGSLLREVGDTIVDLNDPENHPVLYAVQDLQDAANTLRRNLAESSRGPRVYTVPRMMSVADISAALYGGSAEHANEIMLNNNLTDPFAVPAGSKVIWFEAA